jgi:hypothetical protein
MAARPGCDRHGLWRAWSTSTGTSVSTRDGPAQLLAAAVASLPDDHRE